jgi:hypothetical protein
MILTTGCSRPPSEPVPGSYRAVLDLPGGEAPFGLEIAKEQGTFVIYLANGRQRTRVPEVRIIDGEIRATLCGNGNSLQAKLKRDALEGTVTLIESGGASQAIPFHARRGETHRFFKEIPSDNADVSGRWEVQLTDDAGEITQAVASFEQQYGEVTGTVMTRTGDHRFLHGQVRGEEVRLSTFDGGLAYLYRFVVDGKGDLKGEYWQGLNSHQQLVAKRNLDAELAQAD